MCSTNTDADPDANTDTNAYPDTYPNAAPNTNPSAHATLYHNSNADASTVVNNGISADRQL